MQQSFYTQNIINVNRSIYHLTIDYTFNT